MVYQSVTDKIQDLKDMMAVQGSDGNWNHDLYHFGFYNGMAFALSVLTGDEPGYREAPEIFIDDQKTLDNLHKKGVYVRKQD
jgi:hypothetical protein